MPKSAAHGHPGHSRDGLGQSLEPLVRALVSSAASRGHPRLKFLDPGRSPASASSRIKLGQLARDSASQGQHRRCSGARLGVRPHELRCVPAWLPKVLCIAGNSARKSPSLGAPSPITAMALGQPLASACSAVSSVPCSAARAADQLRRGGTSPRGVRHRTARRRATRPPRAMHPARTAAGSPRPTRRPHRAPGRPLSIC
jgi:hypothetical protein